MAALPFLGIGETGCRDVSCQTDVLRRKESVAVAEATEGQLCVGLLPNERVSVRDLVDCTKAIAIAVEKWCL
ncbi:hypothetical protein [Mesorhizobium erdmanii]|uniref:Uncharacterized protein n=1 Tax=Mesorhizobium erdmanii TaxID=1777866 RepID=A0A6M7UJ48_9HYPH|nr:MULTISPECIES: hypothetical protein [Mesorhizobium]OBQ75030.1 hypothetical protein A8146_04760 [Mesorhizobium loti]QKC77185.1 hypothetical protein EB233_18140 [Mesorhizobium erdmanii]